MVAVAFPWSLFKEERDGKLFAYRVGSLARALAVYRVEEVLLFGDGIGSRRDAERLRILLEYQECPQYLRKFVFGRCRDLRFAGVMPPLRTPHHPKHPPREGEVREGFVLRRVRGGVLVEVGGEEPAFCPEDLPRGERVTVRVVSVDPLEVVPAEPEGYWGYTVDVVDGLEDVISRFGNDIVFTSRYGEDVREVRDWPNVECVVFGSSAVGLLDLEPDLKENFLVVNFMPDQGVEVVRTEEAVHATLAVLNYLGLI